eukprot:884200-Lingulodinium_polyedra.AAC.1
MWRPLLGPAVGVALRRLRGRAPAAHQRPRRGARGPRPRGRLARGSGRRSEAQARLLPRGSRLGWDGRPNRWLRLLGLAREKKRERCALYVVRCALCA